MNSNCLICGVGGQGTVLASKLLAEAAMNKGLFVRTAETIGMAQRGGCVVSHVRMGNDIHSPLIPFGKADVILGFEPAEAVRNLHYLKDGGIVIVSDRAVKPFSVSYKTDNYNSNDMTDYLKSKIDNLIIINGQEIIEQCGSVKPLNVVMLGAACSAGALGITADELSEVIKNKINLRFIDINMKALEIGKALAERTCK